MIRKYALSFGALVLALSLAVAAAACGGSDDSGSEAGTGTVSVLSLWGGGEQEAFQKVLTAFTAKTGIKTKYESARDFLPVVRSRLAAGNPPMVAIIPRPGIVADLAKEGSLISLDDLGLDADKINENYGEAWTNLTTVDGTTYGVVAKANSKSVVWYRPDDSKVKPVASFDELKTMTTSLTSDPMKPWALGAKDSWTLTDWFENIYARTAGVEKYNQLFSGELDFTDQSVKDALTQMTGLLNDDSVSGGIDGALGTDFVGGIGKVFSTNPTAHLYMEGGFVGGIALADVNPDLEPGKTIDFFPFPTIDQAQGRPARRRRRRHGSVREQRGRREADRVPRLARGRSDLGLDGRHRLAEQGRAGGRVPERAGQEGGRAGCRRDGLRLRRLRPPPGRARRGLGHAAPERDQGSVEHGQPAESVPAAGTGCVRRLGRAGKANE